MLSAEIGPITLVGALRGPVEEGDRVQQELERRKPRTIVLDLSPEELDGLQEYFGTGDSEPLVPLSGAEVGLARALSKYSDVRMPSPCFVAAVRWGQREGAELVALDENDESYADLFLKHVGYVDLVRRTRAERGLVRGKYGKVATAEEMALLWAERMHRSSGSKRLWNERCSIAARRLKAIAKGPGKAPIVAVIDFERWKDIRSQLQSVLAESAPRAPL